LKSLAPASEYVKYLENLRLAIQNRSALPMNN